MLTLGRRALLGLDLIQFVRSTGLASDRYGGSSSKSNSRTKSTGSFVDTQGSRKSKQGAGRGDTGEPGAAIATEQSFTGTESKSPTH